MLGVEVAFGDRMGFGWRFIFCVCLRLFAFANYQVF
jgi:lactam utilization protein B